MSFRFKFPQNGFKSVYDGSTFDDIASEERPNFFSESEPSGEHLSISVNYDLRFGNIDSIPCATPKLLWIAAFLLECESITIDFQIPKTLSTEGVSATLFIVNGNKRTHSFFKFSREGSKDFWIEQMKLYALNRLHEFNRKGRKPQKACKIIEDEFVFTEEEAHCHTVFFKNTWVYNAVRRSAAGELPLTPNYDSDLRKEVSINRQQGMSQETVDVTSLPKRVKVEDAPEVAYGPATSPSDQEEDVFEVQVEDAPEAAYGPATSPSDQEEDVFEGKVGFSSDGNIFGFEDVFSMLSELPGRKEQYEIKQRKRLRAETKDYRVQMAQFEIDKKKLEYSKEYEAQKAFFSSVKSKLDSVKEALDELRCMPNSDNVIREAGTNLDYVYNLVSEKESTATRNFEENLQKLDGRMVRRKLALEKQKSVEDAEDDRLELALVQNT